jgi:hypothetical protein
VASFIGSVNTLFVDNPGFKFNPSTGNLIATNFNGTASTAKYADLAENYLSDARYAAGTVVIFGGQQEVTISNKDFDTAVAGVVTSNPAYLMNSALTGDHVVGVALVGRVPCQVVGPVRKGDLLVSAPDGYAQAATTAAAGTVIGKSLVDFNGDRGIIEVVVGRT